MGYEKIAPELPLIKGSIMHEMVEAYLKKEDYLKVLEAAEKKFDSLFQEQQDVYGDLIGDLSRIMTGYMAKYKNDGLTYDLIEEGFAVPMFESWETYHLQTHYATQNKEFPSEIEFVGKIDGVAHEESGMSYIVEHKVKQVLPEAGSELTDLQTVLYMKALEIMGKPTPKGIMWDYIRSKAPVQPTLLKTGGLSKAKAQDTDYATYMAAITKYDLQINDYVEMLDYLTKAKAGAFYKRTVMPNPTPLLIRNLWEDVQDSTIQIVMDGPKCRLKNITRDCKFCSFKLLCDAELFNGQEAVEVVLKLNYRKRTKTGA